MYMFFSDLNESFISKPLFLGLTMAADCSISLFFL